MINLSEALSTIQARHILFSILVLFVLISIPGCTREETPKKVSLYTRGLAVSENMDHPNSNVLWFGFDPRFGPKEEVLIYTPFLMYLEKTTGRRFQIKFTERDEDTVNNLGKGVTQFASLGTLNYVIGKNKYGIKYLVSGVNRDGDPKYQSAIFTKPESDIKVLQDLKGRCFAFGSHMSAEGHLIPRNMLEDAGIPLKDLGNYIYTGSHINTARSVLNGECDAGGIQDSLAKRLAGEGKIRIIKMSEPFPGSIIAYNSGVDIETVTAVKSALLAFDPAGRHKNILVEWDRTDMPLGFTEINERELDKVAGFAREYGLLMQ
ncbi:MAG: PhnD/SsuA/transferrin family substrate-binding protein [Nitrospirota bacterium]